ncbi:type II and III secretion system protein family protein [Paraburkholderia sp. DHOC27]|uniref:type II and III secretion system protein family protein n=1 Tax=Paraburkholderia sp. DHOC27 TaxID=2303330 RepID=UPI000E3E0999|nr:type II and III secretion system protein family protein [Paraburkholderia sp. DHOC27]RFU44620.1 type II and III secretion system protein family protein [Paraburkholderia sp. DHOC27]
MNAKSRRLARPSARQATSGRSGGARVALTVMLGAIGAFLWVLPSAQAEGARAANTAVGMVSGTVPAQTYASAEPITVAGTGPIRLTIGSAENAPGAPQPGTSAGMSARGPNCAGPVGEHSTVTVPLGKSTMVNLREPIRERTVGNPTVAQAMLVSPQTLYVVGAEIGTTNMIVQGKSGSCSVIDVIVGADPAGLQQTLAALMPEETGVEVKTAGDSLVLTGTVSDSVKAQRVVELAEAYTQRPDAAVPPAPGSRLAAAPVAVAAGNKDARIINMMQIAAPQQVMLEVKVAEVSKTLIDQLGAQANLNGNIGSWSFGLLAQFLSGGLGAVGASKANTLPLNLVVDAQKSDQLVKILAEPNLMAISGQEASFLAGGKVFIPVPQSNGTAGTTIVLQEEQFGVGLTFTPTVLANGRINLKVAPEVSELSPTGVAVSTGTVAGTAILPLITTRRASTTLQVYDGQSFAIGGLLKSNVTGTLKALPGVGELPVLGALFRSTNYESDKTELVFVVTPRLAKPLPKTYPLPTDSFANVNEANVYATGNMEGTKPAAPAVPASGSTAMPGSTAVVVPPASGLPVMAPAAAPDAAPLPTQTTVPGTQPAVNESAPGAKPIALDEPRVDTIRTAQITVTPLPEPPPLPGSRSGPGSGPGPGPANAPDEVSHSAADRVPILASNTPERSDAVALTGAAHARPRSDTLQ